MSNQLIYLSPDNGMAEKDSDSYGTPQWLFDWLDAEYEFDLDVCASDKNHKCERYFTIDDNALEKDWSEHGSVCFCNPPYSRGLKEAFLKKAHSELSNGVSTVFVIPADLSNAYYRDLIVGKATRITVIHGRVKFNKPHTDEESHAGIGTAIVEFMAHEEPDKNVYWADRDSLKARWKK